MKQSFLVLAYVKINRMRISNRIRIASLFNTSSTNFYVCTYMRTYHLFRIKKSNKYTCSIVCFQTSW